MAGETVTDPRYRVLDRLNGVFWTREILATNRGQLSGGCYVEDVAMAGLFTEEEIGGMRAASLLTSWHEVRAEELPSTARPLDGASAEARHTCRLLLRMVEGELLEHPTIKSDPTRKDLARDVVLALLELDAAMDPDGL